MTPKRIHLKKTKLKLKIPNSTFFKYLILSITSILLIELLKRNVHFDKLMYYSLSEQLTSKQIAKFLEFQKKMGLV